MSKADEQMLLEIWTDINGNATRTQFNGGVKYIRADKCEELREQNRVLLKALRVAVFLDGPDTVQSEFERWSLLVDEGLKQNFNEWYGVQVLAALTATSQPQPRNHGGPSVSCNIANCFTCKDATSQEGQG